MSNKVTTTATSEIENLIKELRDAEKKKSEASDASSKLQKSLAAHAHYTHEDKAVDSWTFAGNDVTATVTFVAAAVLDKNVKTLTDVGLEQGLDFLTTTKATFDTQDMNAAAKTLFLTDLQELCLKHGVAPDLDYSHKLTDRAQIKKKLGAKYDGFMTTLKPSTRITIK